jgi:hypothetical protein
MAIAFGQLLAKQLHYTIGWSLRAEGGVVARIEFCAILLRIFREIINLQNRASVLSSQT